MKNTFLVFLLRGFALFALCASTAFALPGELYVADGNGVVKITPGPIRRAFGPTFGSAQTTGLAFDHKGNLYVGVLNPNVAGSSIVKVAPDGSQTSFATGLPSVQGMSFDSAGNLFVAVLNGAVLRFAPDGSQTTFASGLSSAVGLAIDASDNVFVSNISDGTIVRFTPGGTKTTFAEHIRTPFGLAFDPAGNLCVAEAGASGGSGDILKITPDGVATVFLTGFSGPLGLAFDGGGALYVTISNDREVDVITPAEPVPAESVAILTWRSPSADTLVWGKMKSHVPATVGYCWLASGETATESASQSVAM